MNLQNLYRKFNKTTEDWMYIPKQETQALLQLSYQEDLTDSKRSFLQYKLGRTQESPFRNVLKDLTAFFVLPVFVLKARLSAPRRADSKDALDLTLLKESMPESLKTRFPNNVRQEGSYLNREDLKFFRDFSRGHVLHFFYRFNILRRIAFMRYAKERYGIKAVLSGIEYSYVSSLMTKWCEDQELVHIDIMHGDKLFNPRDAFTRFSEYYVWDQHYADLLQSLYAKGEFKVEVPESFFLKDTPEGHYLTYYLQKEGREEMQKIRQAMLQSRAEHLAVRPHPRFSDPRIVREVFADIEIEDPGQLGILESLSRTRTAVSVYSTVLFQAWLNGRKIIIDDISAPEVVKRLAELDYIMLRKPHELWSDYVERSS